MKNILVSEIKPNPKTNIFLFDVGSSSVNDNQFKLNFITAASHLIKNQDDSSNFIFYKYCGKQFVSNEHSNKVNALKNIANVKYEGGVFNKSSTLNSLLLNVLNKIMLFKDKQVSIVLFSNGESKDDPRETINKLIKMDVSFVCIHYKNLKSLLNQYFPVDTPFFNTDDCIKYKVLKQSIKVPFYYEFFLNCDQLQLSIDELAISMKLYPMGEKTVYNNLQIEIFPNKYYGGHKFEADKTVSYNSPLELDFKLKKESNKTVTDLDTVVKFKIKVENLEFFGSFTIDLAWLTRDFVTNKDINIWVEGIMGVGKSALLNIFLNLFTSNKTIYHHFFTSNKSSDHVTKLLTFNKISRILDYYNEQPNEWLPVYNQIQENIKISLVDKPGLVITEDKISYKNAFNGCYHHNTEFNNLVLNPPKPEYECHVVIFVISLAFIDKNNSEYKYFKQIINQFIDDVQIQPILVVTFCDIYEENQFIELQDKVYHSGLPIERGNIFFLTPYINQETIRDAYKDIQAWKILKKAIDIGIHTLLKSRTQIKTQLINIYITKIK